MPQMQGTTKEKYDSENSRLYRLKVYGQKLSFSLRYDLTV